MFVLDPYQRERPAIWKGTGFLLLLFSFFLRHLHGTGPTYLERHSHLVVTYRRLAADDPSLLVYTPASVPRNSSRYTLCIWRGGGESRPSDAGPVGQPVLSGASALLQRKAILHAYSKIMQPYLLHAPGEDHAAVSLTHMEKMSLTLTALFADRVPILDGNNGAVGRLLF